MSLGMIYVRAQRAQIDVWETLGNKGWNWESLLPYYKKSECFSTKVDLPGVGENLQDQPSTAFSYDANITINGAIPYLAYGAISDFLGTLPDVNLEAWATTVSRAIKNSINASSLEQLFQIQYGLFKQDIPDAESIMESSFTLGSDASKLLDISFWQCHFQEEMFIHSLLNLWCLRKLIPISS
jgi:hypothetical protein